jgi:hypothetical protein
VQQLGERRAALGLAGGEQVGDGLLDQLLGAVVVELLEGGLDGLEVGGGAAVEGGGDLGRGRVQGAEGVEAAAQLGELAGRGQAGAGRGGVDHGDALVVAVAVAVVGECGAAANVRPGRRARPPRRS